MRLPFFVLLIGLLVSTLFGLHVWQYGTKYLPFLRKEPVRFALENSHPNYRVAFNPLRSRETLARKFAPQFSQQHIRRVEILITPTMQAAHPYAWQQPDGQYLFYKSYSFEQAGETLRLFLSLDQSALDFYHFQSGQVAAELEAMLYSAFLSLNPDLAEVDLQTQGDQLYWQLSQDSAARLFLVQKGGDAP